MMRSARNLLFLMTILVLCAGVFGCRTAGSAVETTGDVAGKAIEGAGNVAGEAVEGAGDVVKDATD